MPDTFFSCKNRSFFAFPLFLLLLLFLTPFPVKGEEETPDYADPANWSVLCETIVHDTDLFFVHPTTYGPPSRGKYNADLGDRELNEKTDLETIRPITQAFAPSCNIFAPRYRQLNIEVLTLSEEDRSRYIQLPVEDITRAFTYYLEHLNEGRPFILASHSQGSNVLQLILLSHPELFPKEKLVAAYMPGWTFTDEDLEKIGLSLGSNPEETGVILTWNTLSPGGPSRTLLKGARCVNPLSWTSDTKEYPASENRGARIFISRGKYLEIPHFTSARINSMGGLEIPTPRPEILEQLNMSMGKGCYHRYDYDFFYSNIMDNVAARCKTYRDNHNPNSAICFREKTLATK